MPRTREAKPTINDVARLSGVSKKTVSRVINRSPLLNDATREKVEAVIAELGYVPNPQARALALRRNFVLGMIYDNPNAQMVLNFQEGVLDAIRDSEYALVIHPVDRHSPALFDDIRRFIEHQRLSGVMILPPLSENDAFAALFDELGCAYVRMGSAELADAVHLVQSNDREGVREAVACLIGEGHRRIGLVEGPEGFRSAVERRAGWREALEAHGLPCDETLVARGNYTFETGKAAGAALLDGPAPPTAIFASNDVMAAGVVHVARERGLDVPQDLSVVGFDDTAIAATIWPPLTTVRWPIRTMARSAARKLIHPEAAGREQSRFPTEFVPRASTAPPRR
ncbi:LacI family DNA-binding transcriptional regulator [Novosphingobium piscinae]|uniref:LacI family DNA-binding transcriptional regulator n=1 Tax=Novosphingobium piscinae TaxID=1507448 RepID=A0A7X1KNK8_9SPHN|nr:LacI family DNA-binding transcriptional regulator [Novosphingobium piscinae]MBC2667543.1 LacI family DNA-binding transcriptional regulator [Novosphingobium piscinae]